MRINAIDKIAMQKINFGHGIDMHVHSGHWTESGNMYDLPCPKDTFQKINEQLSQEDKIDKILVSELDCMIKKDGSQSFIKNEIEGNEKLLNLAKDNPNILLYATGQPKSGSADNLKKVIEKAPDKFVGIKLHPEQLQISVDDASYEPYIKLAQEKKVPVLFHTGVNVEWKDSIGTAIQDKSKWSYSDPRKLYELAKKHPDVPIILGHTGSGGYPAHEVAINVFKDSIEKKDANLYCDISWMDFKNDLPADKPESILKLIKFSKEKNCLDKILFGSDFGVGVFGEKRVECNGKVISPSEAYKMTVTKLKNAIRNDDELKADADKIIDKIFYRNADELFIKKNWVKTSANETKEKLKETSKSVISKKAGIILATGLVVISAIVAYLNKKPSSKNEFNNLYDNNKF